MLLLPLPSPPLEHLIGKLDQTHLHNGTNVIKRGEKKGKGKMQTEASSFVGECTLTDHLQQQQEEEERRL